MALINLKNIVAEPIQQGDAGIILRKNGDFQIFSTHGDELDPNNMTERQIEQGKILMAFATAMQIPRVMELLIEMSLDPDIVGHDVANLGEKH